MITWLQSGIEYDLNDRANYYLLKYSGLGLPAFHRLSARGPLQHGTTDRGFRLDPRVIQLIIGVRGDTPDDFHSKRVELDNIFKPMDEPGILRWQIGGRTREIQCFTTQTQDGKRAGLFQEIGIVLQATDPRWYNPVPRIHYFTVGGGGDLGEVPMPIPMLVGVSSLDETISINYQGTAFTSPIITINGTADDVVITHIEKDWKLDFTGLSLGANDQLIIDLRYGQKTVTDQNGDSKLDALSFDSDLASFEILPRPELVSNTIKVEANAVDLSSSIEIEYLVRYIAV